MAVQASALVAGRDVGQLVRGLEAELFEDVHLIVKEPCGSSFVSLGARVWDGKLVGWTETANRRQLCC
jgi:hypothetical protein